MHGKPGRTTIRKQRPSAAVFLLTAVIWSIQIVWGFPQTFLGLLLFLSQHGCEHHLFQGSVQTAWKKKGYGISLGMFIFTDEHAGRQMITHEYGHSVQSLLLGPFYLLIIGLPSMVWCRSGLCKKMRGPGRKSYWDFYTEAWAERIAERYRD